MNTDKARSKVSAAEYEQLKKKYPEMTQNFEGIKREMYEPQIERLGQSDNQPAQPHGKFFEQDKWQDESQGELGQTW